MRARPLRTKITLDVVQPINPCGAYRRGILYPKYLF